MIAIYQSAAVSDPDATAALTLALQERRAFLRRFIATMAEHLRPNVSLQRAIAIMYAITHSAIYQEIILSDGWSPAEYEDWLATTLCQQLLA